MAATIDFFYAPAAINLVARVIRDFYLFGRRDIRTHTCRQAARGRAGGGRGERGERVGEGRRPRQTRNTLFKTISQPETVLPFLAPRRRATAGSLLTLLL